MEKDARAVAVTYYCHQCAALLPSEQALREHLQDAHAQYRTVERGPKPGKKQERFG